MRFIVSDLHYNSPTIFVYYTKNGRLAGDGRFYAVELGLLFAFGGILQLKSFSLIRHIDLETVAWHLKQVNVYASERVYKMQIAEADILIAEVQSICATLLHLEADKYLTHIA